MTCFPCPLPVLLAKSAFSRCSPACGPYAKSLHANPVDSSDAVSGKAGHLTGPKNERDTPLNPK